MLVANPVRKKKGGPIQYLRNAISPTHRAKKSAEVIRTLIIGPVSITLAFINPKGPSKIQRARAMSQLNNPKSAARLIVQLRNLDIGTRPSGSLPDAPIHPTNKRCRPIRAACLNRTEADAWKNYFAYLKPALRVEGYESVAYANLDSIDSILKNFNIENLSGKNFGFGKPVTSKGILAGAVPTAEAVTTGLKLATPELLSLGYVTGQAILPDHEGIHPPKDRMSVFTYWWGFELVLPAPSLAYLSSAISISNAALNSLTAIAVLNAGLGEILPFIKGIRTFLEENINNMLRMDEGNGVVCAATWLIPLALVARPWDFDDPSPATSTSKPVLGGPTPSVKTPKTPKTPPPSEARNSFTNRRLSDLRDSRYSYTSFGSMLTDRTSFISSGQNNFGKGQFTRTSMSKRNVAIVPTVG